MRRCTAKDFQERGITFDHKLKELAAGWRLCPDMEKMDFLRATNGYTNSLSRNSFSLEILKCNKTSNPSC